eukprot:SM000163S02320  [mRNA]  locus=s163:109821:115765:- [translate_table: standard]
MLTSFASKLTQVQFHDNLVSFQWVGPSDQIVFALAFSGNVYRSENGGSTWQNQVADGQVASKRQEAIKASTLTGLVMPNSAQVPGAKAFHENEEDWQDDRIKALHYHPAEPNKIFLQGTHSTHWKSIDYGKSYQVIYGPPGDITQAFQSQSHALYKKETILATVFQNTKAVREQLALGLPAAWSPHADYVISGDFFKSKHLNIVPCGNQLEFAGHLLFLAVAEHCDRRLGATSQGIRLKISSDRGYTFTDACFPYPVAAKSYSIVDVNPTAAFVGLDHASYDPWENRRQGAVLVSDAKHTLFTVALSRTTGSGLPGVYIANQLLPTSPGEEQEDTGKQTWRPIHSLVAKSTTLISYDNGNKWSNVTAPQVDREGKKLNCKLEEGCSLHLHGASSLGLAYLPFLYAHASAPGIIMAAGNVGQYLFEDNIVNTYLSRDAGQVWEEVAKGPQIFEFGDSGGVIVMAQHWMQGITDKVEYSLDEGLSWTATYFAGGPMTVFNIRVEPDGAGRKFLVHGHRGTSHATGREVIVPLDFVEDNRDYRVCNASDYEDWFLPGCPLGQNVTLQRQVRSSKCWNTEHYVRPPLVTTSCPCTVSDYQCDFGYQDVGIEGNRTCVLMDGFVPTASCSIISAGEFAYADSRQRFVPGDVCSGSLSRVGRYYRVSRGGKSLAWWFSTICIILGTMTCIFGCMAYLASKGLLPESVWHKVPLTGWLRFQHIRAGFGPLADWTGETAEEEGHELSQH